MNGLFSASLLAMAEIANPNVHIVSPHEGQVFAPGDVVRIRIELHDPGLVGGAEVGIKGLGILRDETPPYEMSFVIPDAVSGNLELMPSSHSYDGTKVSYEPGESVNIIVRRSTPPDELFVQSSIWIPFPDTFGAGKERVWVTGVFGSTEVDLSPSVVGTTYASSNPMVATVDAEGVLTPVATGWAVITVENRGLKGFAVVDVRAADTSLPPEDVSGFLEIKCGEIRQDRSNNRYTQRITVRNPGELPVPGPLHLVLSGLPADVTVVNRDSATDYVLPGSPRYHIPLDERLNSLMPGARAVFDIEFLNPNQRQIDYRAQIIKGVEI